MERPPEEATRLLVRGLGAYMRAVPARDLPAAIRRLQNFHQKMLMTHAGELLGALDDETTRALVLQWLDDAPSLAKKEERALRLAAERPDGWEHSLAALAPASPSRRPDDEPGRLRTALARESEKVADAREEARRLKEASRKALEAERATVKELRGELQSARRDAAEAAREAAGARAEAERLRGEVEKRERRSRKEVEAARAAAEQAKTGQKGLRKELAAARRRIAELERTTREAVRPKKTAQGRRPEPEGPRRPLPVPKGRLADDPMTLDAWLDAPGVHLLVDGYNVAKAPEGFPDLDLTSQRERLIEQLEKLTLRKRVSTTVVFDGSDVGPGRSRLGKKRVRVEYSRPGETADDHLVAKLASLPPDPVVLVTSDRELQARAGAAGATVAESAQL
nr:NYN domain-containing protein [Actinomycetota bacterium]